MTENKKKKPSVLFRSIVVVLMLLCAAVLALPLLTKKSEQIIAIETQSGEYRTFYTLIAKNILQRTEGLSKVKEMRDDNAMLFVFDEDDYHTMWMKNTYIPLDMLFINDNVIVHIARDTTPFSHHPISTPELADSILEINAGLAERLNIQVGDRVL